MAQSSSTDAMVTDFLNVYQTTTGKTSQLAGAIPADNYDWRPAEGIRSVREAILHVASGNYFFGSMLGFESPEGIDPRTLEQSGMSKDQAIATLEESVEYVKSGIQNMTAKDFETKIDFFGNEVTKRQAMFILGDHAAEHLGQLIAYARSNGVAPPWSQ
ncbi:MAG: DinB family protein [Balneolaceae bacterium]|nr:DinB family protein [Balneolaceae bacterium]